MKNPASTGASDERYYNRATSIALFAVTAYGVFYCINYAIVGWLDRIWIVITGCSVGILAIIILRKARGALNPAFTVPFVFYLVFVTCSISIGSFTGFFTFYFGICAMAVMYFNPRRFFIFIALSNIISLVLILTGIFITANLPHLIFEWIFSVFASLILYLVIKFISEKLSKSVRADNSFITMLSSTPDYIVLVDGQYRVSYISTALAEFAHIEDPKMAIGRPLLDIFHGIDVKLKAAEILESPGLYENTWELHLYGETRYFRIISNRLLGESAGLFISLTDITSLVKARFEVEAATRAKSAFLANTSHEIRTPMNAILGMAELILRKDISPDVYEDVTNIKQAGTNLINIVNDVLDISKIESGKLNIIPVEYRFASLIDDAISMIRMRLLEKHLDFIVNIESSIPSVLAGDETRIRQVLINILNNAVKYTKKGEVRLRVFSDDSLSGKVSSPGTTLIFEVSDTGTGIKQENLDKLFEEFEQFDTRVNRGAEGTGLGLTISRNLCRLMGGDITASSTYGEGSMFRIAIPQEVNDSTPYAKVHAPENKTLIIFEKRTKRIQTLTCSAESLGVRYNTAANRDEFKSLLKPDPSPYVLISFQLLMEAKKSLKPLFEDGSLNADTKLAIYSDYNSTKLPEDFIADLPADVSKNCRLLLSPLHPHSLACFLNDEEGISYNANDFSPGFTAPEARLLIVDDIVTNLKVANGLLKPYLANVDTCLSGAEAIDMVAKDKYDIIFMDHMMPDMDGIEAAAYIRAFEKERCSYSKTAETEAHIPIIALTANAVSGMKEMFIENGFDDFLSKPIGIKKLDEIMWKWIPAGKRLTKLIKPEISSAPVKSLPDIPGIDIKRGIAMTGGIPDTYMQILECFSGDIGKTLVFLNGFSNNIEHDGNTANMMDFTTNIHAIKSAAASVGASEISSQAARLETAGNENDLDFIRQALPDFNSRLAKLARDISQRTAGY